MTPVHLVPEEALRDKEDHRTPRLHRLGACVSLIPGTVIALRAGPHPVYGWLVFRYHGPAPHTTLREQGHPGLVGKETRVVAAGAVAVIVRKGGSRQDTLVSA